MLVCVSMLSQSHRLQKDDMNDGSQKQVEHARGGRMVDGERGFRRIDGIKGTGKKPVKFTISSALSPMHMTQATKKPGIQKIGYRAMVLRNLSTGMIKSSS